VQTRQFRKMCFSLISFFLFTCFMLVCLPGEAASQPDSATAPKLAWEKRYNGKLNLTDIAKSVVADSQGNVIVTGSSITETTADIVTIKYNSSGTVLWTKRYDGGAAGSDVPAGLAVDGKSNVIVTGASGGQGTLSDFVTIKYSPSGSKMWVRRYDGKAHGNDAAVALAVDPKGNIYVTGSSDATGQGNLDYLTLKYDPNGKKIWESRFNGASNRADTPAAIAADGSGRVYVTGMSTGKLKTGIDIATVKYNADGKQAWAKVYDSPSHYFDVGRAIAVDASGNVHVTGEATTSLSQDFVTLKYNSKGQELWAKFYDGPSHHADTARAIALDSQGDVYVTGSSQDEEAVYDYATVKYGPDGKKLWAKRYNGPAKGSDEPRAMVLDTSGNAYITGSSQGSDGLEDILTLKYSPSGSELWTVRYNGPAKDIDVAYGIALGKSKAFYLAGYSMGSGTEEDFLLLKYAQ